MELAVELPGWFDKPGAYVLVDGQFGSTGKGLMASWLAEYGAGRITHVTTNQGPNSGHTAYHDGEKIVTQQLPVASVILNRLGERVWTLLNAGAVIDPEILRRELAEYGVKTMIHPNAALITPDDKMLDQTTLKLVAGTGKGVGPSLAAKVLRHTNILARDYYAPMLSLGYAGDLGWDNFWDWSRDVVFVETAQGFSLGINSSRFYPQVTSRECTVMQAIADARIPAQMVKGVIACFRTYPIRVGNTESSSGDCYEDQEETTWDALGLEPELTTVTKRVRRVFTWSRIQFRECIAANRPDAIFLNFINYLDNQEARRLVALVILDYTRVMRRPPVVLGGYSPYSSDIKRIT